MAYPIVSFGDFISEELLLKYNDKLNPEIWNPDGSLNENVKSKLMTITKEFMQSSNVSSAKVIDIILTGSNANYNYIPNISDLDVHIILDFAQAIPGADKDFVSDYLFDKKVLWANKHSGIRVKGYPVELFYQPYDEYLVYIKQNNYNRGVYSMMQDKWLSKPSYSPPNLNDSNFLKKLNYTTVRIDNMIKRQEYDKLWAFKKRLLALRGEGLRKSGEFSDLNLIYKEIRARGYLDKINNFLLQHQDREWSL